MTFDFILGNSFVPLLIHQVTGSMFHSRIGTNFRGDLVEHILHSLSFESNLKHGIVELLIVLLAIRMKWSQ